MKIEKIELRIVKMELAEPFETSFGREEIRPAIIASIHSEGITGWGECVAGDGPWYSYETIETANHVMTEFLIPPMLANQFEDVGELKQLWKRVRGHPMAKAALEASVWDLLAKAQGVSLSTLIGGVRDRIESGISIGIQRDIPSLLATIKNRMQEGYRRIKLKMKPGWDFDMLQAVRAEFGGISLMADANAAYTIADLPLMQSLDELGLVMIEQPFGYDDLTDHATLQRQIETAICLDESIKSSRTVEQANEMGSCKIVNIKQARVSGLSEAIKIHDVCQGFSMPVWCGGMLETGIGRAHNVALSSLPGFSMPNDLSASSRYYAQDIIEPLFELNSDGTLSVPTDPGIGVEVSLDELDRVTHSHEVFQ